MAGGGKFSMPVGGRVNTGFRNGVTESGSVSGSNSLSEAKDFLDQYGRSHSWGTQKDAFDKIAQLVVEHVARVESPHCQRIVQQGQRRRPGGTHGLRSVAAL